MAKKKRTAQIVTPDPTPTDAMRELWALNEEFRNTDGLLEAARDGDRYALDCIFSSFIQHQHNQTPQAREIEAFIAQCFRAIRRGESPDEAFYYKIQGRKGRTKKNFHERHREARIGWNVLQWEREENLEYAITRASEEFGITKEAAKAARYKYFDKLIKPNKK